VIRCFCADNGIPLLGMPDLDSLYCGWYAGTLPKAECRRWLAAYDGLPTHAVTSEDFAFVGSLRRRVREAM
jgi:hypothetical protein